MFAHETPQARAFGRLAQFLAIAVIVMGLAIGREISSEAQRVVFGQREVQIFVPYSGEAPITLPPVLIVAHNAGDQESTVRRALLHGATAIEIDVRSVGGVLYATHSQPPELLPLRLWQAPRFWQAWRYTAPASAIKLDLKSTNQYALDSLAQFLEHHASEQQIIISSKDRDALTFFDRELPNSLELLSVSTGQEIDTLLETKGRIEGIDGISTPSWVLSEERVLLLLEHGYLIDAWAVNDVNRLVELATFGVDIITTDNLAFFAMQVGDSADPSSE